MSESCAHAMLKAGMQLLFNILLLFLLAGCATPYYPVHTSSDGAYYITEAQTAGPVYGNPALWASDIVTYPWWMGSYPAELFVYYSPYYYPYYFSIHNPSFYHPFYDFYRRHHVYRYPPHSFPRPDDLQPAGGQTSPPFLPPHMAMPTNAPLIEIRRSNDLARPFPTGYNGRSTRRSTHDSRNSLPVTGRSSSAPSFSAAGSRSASRSVTRSSAPKRSGPYSNPSSNRNRQ